MTTFTKIRPDVNGNPRYVCDFYSLLTEEEKALPLYDYQGRRIHPTKYEMAVKRANKLGGRKYNNKSYGGGIVFQSYNIKELEKDIAEAIQKAL